MEHASNKGVEQASKLRVVARTFVAHKGVRAIYLKPGKPRAGLVEAVEHSDAAFSGNVWVLAAPDHQQFAANVAGASE